MEFQWNAFVDRLGQITKKSISPTDLQFRLQSRTPTVELHFRCGLVHFPMHTHSHKGHHIETTARKLYLILHPAKDAETIAKNFSAVVCDEIQFLENEAVRIK